MPAIVTSRVVTEIYRGIDFPSDWNTGNATITVDMTRERLMSVIVLLDADKQPLAAGWQVEGQEEQFVRIRYDRGEKDDLLDSLNTDLREQSSKLGDPDLFAALLWEPEDLRADQAICVLRYILCADICDRFGISLHPK